MRTTRHLIFLHLVLTVAVAKAQNANDWENPQTIGINKEQTTATFSFYKNEVDAVLFITSNSEISLNGNWKINWVAKPDERPADFYKSAFYLWVNGEKVDHSQQNTTMKLLIEISSTSIIKFMELVATIPGVQKRIKNIQ